MQNWNDIENAMSEAVDQQWAEDIEYISTERTIDVNSDERVQDDSYTICGIFNETSYRGLDQEYSAVSINETWISVDQTQFTSPPKEDDLFIARGREYEAKQVLPDGMGRYRINLFIQEINVS